MNTRKRLRHGIPRELLLGLDRYRDQHIEPGGFLRAVLENDLVGVTRRGTEWNLLHITAIVVFCTHHLPVDSWGSEKAVAVWLAMAVETRPMKPPNENAPAPHEEVDGGVPEFEGDGTHGKPSFGNPTAGK